MRPPPYSAHLAGRFTKLFRPRLAFRRVAVAATSRSSGGDESKLPRSVELPLDSLQELDEALSPTLRSVMCGATDENPALLANAVLVYGSVSQEALSLGIPQRALPPLPSPLTVDGVRAATDLMQRIIASRLSSNL